MKGKSPSPLKERGTSGVRLINKPELVFGIKKTKRWNWGIRTPDLLLLCTLSNVEDKQYLLFSLPSL